MIFYCAYPICTNLQINLGLKGLNRKFSDMLHGIVLKKYYFEHENYVMLLLSCPTRPAQTEHTKPET